jgi:citrate synthase
MAEPKDLSAREAAKELGISQPTLYAYVSRGLIRSRPSPSDPRARRYSAADIARLKVRQEQRREPDRVAETALDWGAPLLESRLTLIESERLYYRGHDAIELAERHTLEAVAGLLWAGELRAPEAARGFEPPPSTSLLALDAQLKQLTPLQRFQALLPVAAAQDQAAYHTRPAAVQRSGLRILRLLASVLSGDTSDAPVAELLQRWLAPERPEVRSLLDSALVLCADHELNISAFTARCVASAGATPYEVVGAGLAALQGVRHGGQTERTLALLREVGEPANAQRALGERLRRGDAIPGFGHRLYPGGDPRAEALLRHTAAIFADSPALKLGQAVSVQALALLDERPTIDFALAVLAEALDAPPGTALALFALGRSVGWIAHAIEEYEQGRLIRPRARYSGPPPQPSGLDR